MEDGRVGTYVRCLNGRGQARSSVVGARPRLLDRPEFAALLMSFAVGMEGLMPIDARYGDKNYVSLQRLDLSPAMPKAMLYLQVSYTIIAAVFGAFC